MEPDSSGAETFAPSKPIWIEAEPCSKRTSEAASDPKYAWKELAPVPATKPGLDDIAFTEVSMLCHLPLASR